MGLRLVTDFLPAYKTADSGSGLFSYQKNPLTLTSSSTKPECIALGHYTTSLVGANLVFAPLFATSLRAITRIAPTGLC